MGSCLSSCSGGKNTKGDDEDHQRRHRRCHRDYYGRQDRPSSPDEEPVVKEVLSETPKPSFAIPSSQPPKSGESFLKLPMPPFVEVPAAGSATIPDGKPDVEPEPEPEPEAETEVSEICSVSETVSVSTTFTDRGEMEEESKRRVVEHRSANNPGGASGGPRYRKKRSLSGELTVPRREHRRGGVGGSGGRSSRSPARRGDSGGAAEYAFGRALSSCREMDRTSQPIAPRLARRDPGERSGRRSVSPAAKRVLSAAGNRSMNGGSGTGNGMARVAQGAQPGKANNRVPPSRPLTRDQFHDCRLENPAGKHPATAEAPSSEKQQQKAATGDNGDDEETLENPLVALECFIFL